MPDDITTIEARYQQTFQMAGLAIEPELAGARHTFQFEGHHVAIVLPPLPANDAPPAFSQQNPFLLAANVCMWDASSKPLAVAIGSIGLTIEGLQFQIPLAAADHPHINATLFNEEQRQGLDERSDALHFLAARAMAHWLRVVWWKTGFYMINQRSSVAGGGSFDGGGLINTKSGTRFYAPRVSRTIVLPPQPIVRVAQWSEVAEAINGGTEPPVWHDYLASANQRMEAGDRLAGVLDLAVAVEARIRTDLDGKLPSGTAEGFRRAIHRQNLSDVFRHWRAYGLPNFPDLKILRALFVARNEIMHNGRAEQVDVPFFKTATEAVAKLLAIL